MRQKDIYFANLNPTKGSEQRGIRPIVIVSGNAMNDNLGVCIICPLSTKIKNYAGCILLKKDKINSLKEDSEVITFQIRAISMESLTEKIGEIADAQLEDIKKGLNDILTY